jgi:hypothetical protein
MEIQGHFQNGMIVPHDGVSLPDGAEVTITVRSASQRSGDTMSGEEQKHYLAALAKLDAVANENPGDTFSGTDHDRELYGKGS